MNATAPSESLSRARLTSGDPLRAIAALAVLVFHAGTVTILSRHLFTDPAPLGTFHYAFLALSSGIWIFFVLSGYLLSRPFLRWVLVGARRPAMKRYAANRLLRIVPAFWVAIPLTALVVGTGGTDWKGWVATFAFWQPRHPSALGQNIVQAWSLHVELAYYFVMPIFLGLTALALRGRVRPQRAALVLLGLVGAIFAASVAHRAGTSGGHDSEQFVAAVCGFCPGVAAAIVEVAWGDRLRDRALTRRLGTAMLGVSAAFYLTLILIQPKDQRVAWLAVVAAGALVVAPVVRQWSGTPPWRALDLRPLHWIGERSYSLYLLHFMVVNFVVKHFGLQDHLSLWPQWWAVTAITLLIAIPASALTYRYVERPFLQRRLPWRSDPQADAAAHQATAGEPPAPAPAAAAA